MGTQSELKSKIRFKLKFKIKLKPKFRLELQANNQDLQYTSLQSSKQRMSNCFSIFAFYATSQYHKSQNSKMSNLSGTFFLVSNQLLSLKFFSKSEMR